jgi:hypothetical protein
MIADVAINIRHLIPNTLAFVGYDGKWVLEEGHFRMQAGDQVVNIACAETKKWDIPNLDKPEPNR